MESAVLGVILDSSVVIEAERQHLNVAQFLKQIGQTIDEREAAQSAITVAELVHGIFRIRDEAGAFRVLYVAKFADAIYVLHCFQKKTERTSKADVELAAKRYRELLKEPGQ
jgi:phage-related protein